MKRIALVLGEFHKPLIEIMLAEAEATAKAQSLEIAEVIWVPGAVEKPLAIKRLLMRDDIDGVAVLGIIERGQTKHGFTMGQSLMHYVMGLQLEFMKPIGLGVLGPEIEHDQIDVRLKPYAHKAVYAVAQMLQ